MNKFRGILYELFSYLPSRRIIEAFEDPQYLIRFDKEIILTNFTRLRYLTYAGVFITLFLFYTDFLFANSYSYYQLRHYFILDIICGIATIAFFLVTHIKPPKSYNEIKTYHSVVVCVYILFHVCWSASVSAIEVFTIGSFPSILIGIFSGSILFLFRRHCFMLATLLGVAVIVTMLHMQGLAFSDIYHRINSIVALVALAFLVSRLMLHTRIKSYISAVKLELINNYLDETVLERTHELIETNEQLNKEINERKRNEEHLFIEKKRAEEADRLKTVFLGNISHEIRTPVNGIIGFGQLLEVQKDNPKKRQEYIDIINMNSRHLLSIIENILDISLIETNQLQLKPKNFSISMVIESVYREIQDYIIEKDIRNVELIRPRETSIPTAPLFADLDRLKQVLYNLLVNAVKFTEEGTVKFGCYKVDDNLHFFVEDTGIGINEEHAEYIFEPFRQADESISRSFGGNGLGLSISKGLVEKLGGTIWHDESYKGGARFCFTVPIINEKS